MCKYLTSRKGTYFFSETENIISEKLTFGLDLIS
jgi:hypothetical protein